MAGMKLAVGQKEPKGPKKDVDLFADVAGRVAAIDWEEAARGLDAQGCAVLKTLLSAEECRALAALYADDKLFRSRIVIQILLLSTAAPDRRPASAALRAPARNRQPLERSDGDRYQLPRKPRSVSRPMP
jgi:hypothetical protein